MKLSEVQYLVGCRGVDALNRITGGRLFCAIRQGTETYGEDVDAEFFFGSTGISVIFIRGEAVFGETWIALAAASDAETLGMACLCRLVSSQLGIGARRTQSRILKALAPSETFRPIVKEGQ